MSDEEIVVKYGNTVYAIAMNYVHNRFDADDVYSETFLCYFKKDRKFESEEHRKAYIIKLAINCSKDFLSSKHRHESVLIHEITPDAERITDNGDLMLLKTAMEALQPEERNLIYLFYYQQMKSAEIAAMLETGDDSIRSKLKRIRKKMRDVLKY